VDVSSTQRCPAKSITVVKAGDGKDVDAAAAQVVQALRDAGYTVTFEEPANVVGNWIGTYVVGSSEFCGTSICAKKIAGVLRHGGFRPALNSFPAPTASEDIACAYSVYVGVEPKTVGQFILY
jgi:hypothetical protein